jgi:hypothetical protein
MGHCLQTYRLCSLAKLIQNYKRILGCTSQCGGNLKWIIEYPDNVSQNQITLRNLHVVSKQLTINSENNLSKIVQPVLPLKHAGTNLCQR